MVVLLDAPERGFVALRPSRTDRVRARLLAARSDRHLARGIPPERDISLALRAERLVRADTREVLARSLRRLLDEARRPPRVPPSLMSFECRRRIMESAEVVGQLIAALRRPGPVSSQGVASLCILLRDGSGPLYRGDAARELPDRLPPGAPPAPAADDLVTATGVSLRR